MMRKHLFINALLAVTVCMTTTACFEDETTIGNRPLSEIVLNESSVSDVYNINKNDVLTIRPVYSQTNGDKPVTITWEIDQKVYSQEPVLTYTGKELGSWNCRLILENEDGKTFHPFRLNVNSPYEEGITILSKDDKGTPYLAFLPTDADGASGEFFPYDCLCMNNEDTKFASYPSDIVQSAGTLIFACQGNGTDNDSPTIYYINEKTLVVENILHIKEYDDFKPSILGIPSMDASGVAYPILCENGKTYEFSTTEGAIVKPTKFKFDYAQSMIVRDNGSGWNYEIVVWDKDINALCLIYNGYGPYYLSYDFDSRGTRSKCVGVNNYFNGFSFCHMTYIRMTKEQGSTNSPKLLIIVNNGPLYQKATIDTSFWRYNFDTAETILADNGGKSLASVMNCPLTETTPSIANMTYHSLLFADGNKVRRWYYTTSQYVSNADVLLTVGSKDAVITGFEMSNDHKRTYVSFYEPNESGKNGHLWIFDTDNGMITEKYDNISYQPVKMLYKKK